MKMFVKAFTFAVILVMASILAFGTLSMVLLALLASEWILNKIAQSWKVHDEFLDFLRHKYARRKRQ